MITSDQRKQIERMAYDAVKALTGEQYSLSMVSYVNTVVETVMFAGEDILLVSGQFRFWNKSVNYYDLEIKNSNVVSVVPVEVSNVSTTT